MKTLRMPVRGKEECRSLYDGTENVCRSGDVTGHQGSGICNVHDVTQITFILQSFHFLGVCSLDSHSENSHLRGAKNSKGGLYSPGLHDQAEIAFPSERAREAAQSRGM